MFDPKIQHKTLLLRERVDKLLCSPPPSWYVFTEMMSNLESHGWSLTLFGGLLRDLMLTDTDQKPRDVDVVVGNATPASLFAVLSSHTRRKTRFGGLHLKVEDWHFDVWPLCETWAFRHALVTDCSPANLPKTTFLNIEAIATTMPSTKRKTEVFSHGFFESLLNRQVEINLEDNPFPALCVARSLIMASKLGFEIGPRLARYIAYYSNSLGLEEIHAAHLSHYGRDVCSLQQMDVWLKVINEAHKASNTDAVHLPASIRILANYDENTAEQLIPSIR